jgi:hypothetical protein
MILHSNAVVTQTGPYIFALDWSPFGGYGANLISNNSSGINAAVIPDPLATRSQAFQSFECRRVN